MTDRLKSRILRLTLYVAVLVMGGAVAAAQEIGDRKLILNAMKTCESLISSDTVSIVFGGDFMMHKAQIDNALKDGSYDFAGCLEPVRRILEEADLAAGNMEFTLGGMPYSGYPAFSAPEEWAEYIADCGVDVFLLANNHILDRGAAGAERTLDYYRKMQGIRFCGCAGNKAEDNAVNPLYIRLDGIKTAFVNFTYGTNAGIGSGYPEVCLMRKESLEGVFEKARRDGAEIIIALPHWGPEYRLEASQEQRETARWLAMQGADAIIGSHPHVVQDTEEILCPDGRRVPVIYSLGNLISNMSAKNTRTGMLFRLKIARNEEGKAVIAGQEQIYTWCSLPGRFADRHTALPVSDYIGRRGEWENPADYDTMISTYMNIKAGSSRAASTR